MNLLKTEGNQGIEEHLKREKVTYCNSLRELSVRGKWLTNLYPKNVKNKATIHFYLHHNGILMFCFEFFNLLFSLQKKNRKNRAQIQVNCRLEINNNILEMFKMIKEEDNNLNSQNLLNNQELISKGIVLMMAMNWTMMKIMLVFRISQLILKKAMDKRELIASTETAILIVM